MIYYLGLFFFKVIDNVFSTARTILVQKNKPFFAGMAIFLSDLIYYTITKNVVTSDSFLPIIIVALASGVGCYSAVSVTDKISKDRMYVNAILSDDKDAIVKLYDYFIANNITAVISDSYTRDWEKAFVLTVYSDTKAQSKVIDQKITESGIKAKRVITNE